MQPSRATRAVCKSRRASSLSSVLIMCMPSEITDDLNLRGLPGTLANNLDRAMRTCGNRSRDTAQHKSFKAVAETGKTRTPLYSPQVAANLDRAEDFSSSSAKAYSE